MRLYDVVCTRTKVVLAVGLCWHEAHVFRRWYDSPCSLRVVE